MKVVLSTPGIWTGLRRSQSKTLVDVVADHGLGWTEPFRTYQALGSHHVIRIRPEVYEECEQFREK